MRGLHGAFPVDFFPALSIHQDVLIGDAAGARSNPSEMRSSALWSANGREMRLLAAPVAQTSAACKPRSGPPVPVPHSAQPAVRSHGTTKGVAAPPKFYPRPTDIIRVLVQGNPKLSASKSRQRFDCYRDGMTVADYETALRQKHGDAEAHKFQADLQWNSDRSFIRLERDGRPIEMLISPSMQRS